MSETIIEFADGKVIVENDNDREIIYTYTDTIDGQEVEVQVIPPQIPMRRGASPEFPFIHGGQVTHARVENPIDALVLDLSCQ